MPPRALAREAETAWASASSASPSGSSSSASSPMRCASACASEQSARPGIPGQQRPVEVRPNYAADPAAFESALPVVSEAGNHATQRLRTGVEERSAGVVLETGERPTAAGLELTFEQHVADHPALAGGGVEREETHAGQLDAAPLAVEPPEQLIPAADRGDGL